MNALPIARLAPFLLAAGYAVAATTLYPLFGPSVLALGLVPVVAAGWTWGPWAGLLAAGVALAGNTALLNHWAGGGWGAAAAAAVGFAAGLARRDADRLGRAEAAVRESEERLRVLLDGLPHHVWVRGPGGEPEYFNHRCLDYHGLSPDNTNTWDWRDAVHPDDLPRATAAWTFALRTATPYRVEYRLRGADGAYRWHVGSADPVRGPDGRVVRWFGTGTDVEEQKRAEEAQARLAALVESTDAAVVSTDRDGVVRSWNPGAERLYGYTAAEMVGAGVAAVVPPELRPAARERRAAAWRGEGVAPFETERVRKDGRRVPVSVILSPVRGADGRVIALSGISQDITDRKRAADALRKSEAFLRLVWESAADGMRLTDAAGAVVLANEAYCRMVGRPRAAVEGRPLADAYAAADREHIAGRYRERFAARDVPPHQDAEVELWDGRRRWFEVANACLDTPGEPPLLLSVFRDVSRRKGAEAAVRESEARYRHLFDANPQPMWVYDTDTLHVLAVNDAAVARYGYTRDEFLGLTVADLRPAEDVAEFRAVVRDRPAAARPDRARRHRWKDGTVREVEITSHALTYLDRPARLVLAHDITDRVRAEAALREGERRFRETLEAVRLAAVWLDADGRVSFCNDAFLEMTGYGRDEVIGRDYFDPFVPADARAGLRPLFEQAMRTGGVPVHHENPVLTRAGDRRLVAWSNTVLRDPAGRPVGISSLGEDITDRRRAEDALRESEGRFRALLEHATDFVAVFAPDGTTRYESPSVERLGYTPDELVGRPAWDRIHPDDLPGVQAKFAAVLARPGEIEAFQARYQHKDGTWRVLEGSGRFVPGIFGTGGVVVNSHDVTDRAELEDRLRHAQKMEAVGQLAGGVAHDFNNILTAINGFAELLLEGVGRNDPSWEPLSEIRRAGERAGGLTRQLLAFSRRQVLSPKVLDLNAAVGDAERMLRRLIGADIVLATALAPDLGRVKADPTQIEQVLLNLAVNARDAMPRGGRLALETANVTPDEAAAAHPDAAPGEYVRVAVRDTGAGIDAETRARLFEPFFTTKKNGQGTGLGLATVYGIVKQSGGFLAVDSEPGRGTTFHVYLPRVPDPTPPRPAAGTSVLPHGGETVLLAEDEPAVRALAGRILRSCGYQVIEARDGREAVLAASLCRGRIHLLVSDVVMPHVGGRELAETLLADRPDLRVLFLSGYTDDAVIRHGILGDEFAFLQKPFTPGVLARTVREVLDAAGSPGREVTEAAAS